MVPLRKQASAKRSFRQTPSPFGVDAEFGVRRRSAASIVWVPRVPLVAGRSSGGRRLFGCLGEGGGAAVVEGGREGVRVG